jgi:hypothetical protein
MLSAKKHLSPGVRSFASLRMTNLESQDDNRGGSLGRCIWGGLNGLPIPSI